MHEYSIVQALLDQCENIAKENEASTITKVVTKIGAMSGVETHLLQTAFDTFKEGTMCKNAQFVINYQKIKLRCNDCSNEFEIDGAIYECSNCKSTGMDTIDGEDMYLMSLEME